MKRIVLITVIVAVPHLGALDPSMALSQYAKRHWQVEDGLPAQYVTSIVQAADGRLVMGTSRGAAYFDGVGFTPVAAVSKSRCRRAWVEKVAPAPDGSIWITTRNAGLYRCVEGDCQPRKETSYANMLWDRRGALVRLTGAGLFRRDALLLPNLVTRPLSWHGLLEKTDGALLIATQPGLIRYQNGRAEIVGPGDGLALAPARDGSHWLGTEQGLFRANGQRVAGIPGPVVAVLEDRDGTVWAGTWGRGLYRLAGGRVSAATSGHGILDDFVHELFEDREGNLWIGSRAGLSRWKSTAAAPFGPPEGLRGRYFSAITGSPDGQIWAGSWRSGLFCLKQGTPRRIAFPKHELEALIYSMSYGPDGSLWVAERLSLLRYRGGTWKSYRHIPDIQVVFVDDRGVLYLGAASGLYCFPQGEPAPPLPEPHFPGRSIRALLRARDGTLWTGTTEGLFRNRESVAGLPSLSITSIAEDTRGRIWITTDANGVVLASGEPVRVFDEAHGLPALPIRIVVDDGVGSLWLTSQSGLYQVPVSQMDALIAGCAAKVEPIHWNQEDGLRTVAFSTGAQPGAWKDAAGDLWFTTTHGLLRIRPRLAGSLASPSVLPTGEYSQDRAHTLEFTALRLGDSRVEFRYRLNGQEWVRLGQSRSLHLNGLPAGTHTVLVAARDEGRQWGPPASWTLTQTPEWHETWWFRVLVALAAAVLLNGIYRWRMYLERNRHRAVLAERNRISQEWHDTLLGGFSAISWQLDVALERLRSQSAAATEAVEVARKMVQHCRIEARRVISDLRQQGCDLTSLSQSVAAALREITEHHGVDVFLDVKGSALQLPVDVAQNVLRICQEAATNAVRHGSPSHIAVRLEFGDRLLAVSVEDDGTGFHPGQVPAGRFGLAIMEERVRRFNGELRVESDPGRGTRIVAAIPLPRKRK